MKNLNFKTATKSTFYEISDDSAIALLPQFTAKLIELGLKNPDSVSITMDCEIGPEFNGHILRVGAKNAPLAYNIPLFVFDEGDAPHYLKMVADGTSFTVLDDDMDNLQRFPSLEDAMIHLVKITNMPFEEFKSKCAGIVAISQCDSNNLITFDTPHKSIVKLESYFECDAQNCELIEPHSKSVEFHGPVSVSTEALQELYDQLTSDQLENLKQYVLISEEYEPTLHLYMADIVSIDLASNAPSSSEFTEDFTDF